MMLLSNSEHQVIKNIEALLKPVYQKQQDQATFYENAIKNTLKALQSHFIIDKESDEERLKALNAKTSNGLWLFNYETYRASLEDVLSNDISTFKELDEAIESSNLPISYDDHGKYNFNEMTIQTEKGREFFKKLTFMLNCLRLSIAIKQIYQSALSHSFIDIESHHNALDASLTTTAVKDLQSYDESELRDAYDIYKDWQQWTNSALYDIEDGKDDFEKDSIQKVGAITELLARLAEELSNAYKAFPNPSISRFVQDSPWLTFLKTIANELVTQSSYTWSSYDDTFTITDKKLKDTQSNWMEFHDKTLTHVANLKATFLKKASQKFNKVVNEIVVIATKNKYDLSPKIESTSYFSNNNKSSVYGGYVGFYATKEQNRQEELHDSSDSLGYE
jgi:hypothetical protein